MGESLVDAPKVENEMGESGNDAGAALQVSVSFGRFENDSLCWEKWSAFPTNKYLEEVEKCATPGSVAQKKAYFEAHYKRIAARKAELMGEEKNKGSDSANLGYQDAQKSDNQSSVSGGEVEKEVTEVRIRVPDNVEESSDGAELEDEVKNVISEGSDCVVENPVNEVELVEVVGNVMSEASNNITENFVNGVEVSEVSSTVFDEPSIDADKSEESSSLLPVVDAKDDSCIGVDIPKLEKSEAAALERADASSLGNMKAKETIKDVNLGREKTPRNNDKNLKSKAQTKQPKVATAQKATNSAAAKKKPASLNPRSPLISTPKPSKPVFSRTVMSATRPSARNDNGSTPLTGKKPTGAAEIKRIPPNTSLHMSLSLGPANSDPGPVAISRKSLIMERMGDKDIVKRAFKTFRNNFGQLSSSSVGKPSETSQISINETERRKSFVSETSQKKNEGINKAVKASTPTAQQGQRMTSNSSRFLKTGGYEQRNGPTVSSSFGWKSYDGGDKKKGFSKKLEEKSSSKEAGRTLIHPKMKVEKEIETKKRQESTNLKAKQTPDCYRGSGKLKSSVHKKDA